MTQSRSSSNEDSKRNSIGGRDAADGFGAAPRAGSGIAPRARRGPCAAALAAAFLSFGLFLHPAPIAAQAVDLTVVRRASTRAASADALVASVSFRWERREELVSSLRAGMESRVTFTVRLYEHRRGLLSFRRDRLLAEKSRERSAFWDFLDGSFVVESKNGERASFASAEDLLQGFLTLSDITLSEVPRAGSPGYYVTARALFEPVRLMPPLTLVGLVGRAATATTPWASREAP